MLINLHDETPMNKCSRADNSITRNFTKQNKNFAEIHIFKKSASAKYLSNLLSPKGTP